MARPNPPTVDLKDLLVSAGVGTFAATSGWGIYVGHEPDGDQYPDTVIALFDTSGAEPNPKWLSDEPHVQVLVRGARNEYLSAYDKSYEVLNTLLGLPQQVVNGTVYVGVWALADPHHLLNDDNRRPVFTLNLRMFREPADGTHRESL